MPDDLSLISFLNGGTVVALAALALFFLRFWQSSGDKLFAFFASSFFLLSVSQTVIVATSEFSPIAFWLRAAAFLLIITAIVGKNLPEKQRNDQ